MGYEHLSTISEMESDEITESSAKNLVPIPNEYEVTSDNESECDVPVCEDSFDVLEDHYEILSDSNNDDTSSDGNAFKDIEYVEASLPDSELVSLEEENDYDLFCFEIEPDQERLTSVVMKDISDDSSNDPLLEKDDPSFPCPPPEPPDAKFFFDFEPNSEEVILDEFNEDECFDPGGEIDVLTNVEDDDYFPFIFIIQNFLPYLIYPEVSPLLLCAGSEDTIFDHGISA
nr:hypothetical protein [Tanacetum cinerariifolium]